MPNDPSRPDVGNVAARLTAMARAMPEALAVVEPLGYDGGRKRRYRTITFRELDEQSDRIALGLGTMGVGPGTRMVLLVRPGIDFVASAFALWKAGAVTILIDPGMGGRKLVGCLAEAEPEGFLAVPSVQAARVLLRRRFPKSRFHVTVGRRWLWGGTTLDELRQGPRHGSELAPRAADDSAAIIFTTGSTGPPKGVLYTHGVFHAQIEALAGRFGIGPGEVDLATFPLFGLFDVALGVTAVVPDMDPTRPGRADPARILEAVHDWNVTQAFGSPALWNRVGRYCREHGARLPTLRRVFSAGAPVPADVLSRMKNCIHPEGDVHTPYGATEALPVASISATEVLDETAARTRQGAGVCVGRRFPGIAWRVVRIVDGPIATLEQCEPVSPGEIGELVVSGPVVTRQYVTRPECNKLAKIADGPALWHRMGDAGYLDPDDRFWYCGRVAHRVITPAGPMYTIPCEAIFNQHPDVLRSALVGIGPAGRQTPAIVVEPHPERFPGESAARAAFTADLRELAQSSPITSSINTFLFHPGFPVDVRHNAKIFREQLAEWAGRQ